MHKSFPMSCHLHGTIVSDISVIEYENLYIIFIKEYECEQLGTFQLNIDLINPIVYTRGLHSHFVQITAFQMTQGIFHQTHKSTFSRCKQSQLCFVAIRSRSHCLQGFELSQRINFSSPQIKQSKNTSVWCGESVV